MKNIYSYNVDENISIEKIKTIISNTQYQYICFECFNTLINIPFIKKEHIYYLIDKHYEKKYQSGTSFHKIRIESEELVKLSKANKTSITLQDIYIQMNKTFNIPISLCEHLKSLEIELVKKFCSIRKSIKELYDLSVALGKKVVIYSYSLLEKELIEQILKKNGIYIWDSIFVFRTNKTSNELGSLDIIPDTLKISYEKIFFIGNIPDNNNFHFVKIPTPIESMYLSIKEPLPFCDSTNIASIGYCCSIAIVANHYFDNPFRDFKSETKFNTDPYFLGFFALGLHLLAIVFWIIKETTNYKRIIFMSRDGYLVKEAYDIIKSYYKSVTPLPISTYLYISRKLMLPIILNSYADFINFPSLDVCKATPKTMFELLKFCTKDLTFEELKSFLQNINLNENSCFKTSKNYLVFIESFMKNLYDKDKHEQSRTAVNVYLKKFNNRDITFDLGNYGRIQSAFSKSINTNIDALFLFANINEANIEMRKNKFKIKTFYNYYPQAYRNFREYILSCREPSCIGVKMDNNKIKLLFEHAPKKDVAIEKIHMGAIDFIKLYCDTFSDYLSDLVFWPEEMSIHFEKFLTNPQKDIEIFQNSFFEGIFNNQNIMSYISEKQK